MSDITVFRIQGSTNEIPYQYSRFGISDVARNCLKDEVRRLAFLGQAALKSAVPIRERELQNAIQIDRVAGSGDTYLNVVIRGSHRSTSDTMDQLFNSDLAELLNEGIQRRSPEPSSDVFRYSFQSDLPGRRNRRTFQQNRFSNNNPIRFRRSQSSDSFEGFEIYPRGDYTAGWVDKAQSELLDLIG